MLSIKTRGGEGRRGEEKGKGGGRGEGEERGKGGEERGERGKGKGNRERGRREGRGGTRRLADGGRKKKGRWVHRAKDAGKRGGRSEKEEKK